MKKQFQNLMFAIILVAASTAVHAQSWDLVGNIAGSTSKLGTTNNIPLNIYTNNAKRITVKGNGQVGIATTTPVNKLEIDVTNPEDGIRIVQKGSSTLGNGAASVHLKNNTPGGKMWSIHSLGSGNTNQGSGNFLIEEADDYMVNNVDRFLIQKGTGNVGIGTSAPNDKVEINAGVAAHSGLRFTQLTAATPTVAGPGDFMCNKVLSVDNNGEVILIDLSSCGSSSKVESDDASQLASQQVQIDDLKSQIAELKALLGVKAGAVEKVSLYSYSAHLIKIAPNPLSQSAIVSYQLPDDATNAQIVISDSRGDVVKSYNLVPGSVQQEIGGSELTSGTYQYTLYVQGSKVDSKQMVIAK